MGKSIIITEEQYKRIFLTEQSNGAGNKIAKIPTTNWRDDMRAEKMQSGSYDTEGGVGQGKNQALPSTGSIKGDNKAQADKMKPRRKVHDATCNDKHRQSCSNDGQIATDVGNKGRDWDLINGNYTIKKDGSYNTTGNLLDNKDYTFCKCKKGYVETYSEKMMDPTVNNYKGGMVTVEHNRFIETDQIRQNNSKIGGDKWDALSDFEKRRIRQDEKIQKQIKSKNWARLEYNATDEFIKEYIHEIIDVLAVGSYFLGPPGVLVSLGLEAVNAGLYFQEGEVGMGIASIAFMLIPAGGPLLRNLTKPAIKKVTKIFKNFNFLQKSGKFTDEEVLKKWLITQKEGLKDGVEKDLLDTVLGNVDKLKGFKKLTEKELKLLVGEKNELWKKFLKKKKYHSGFGNNSRFLDELMNPTKVEKFVFAGAVLGMIYLDKSGKMEVVTNKITKWLMEVRGISQEEAPIAIINIEETIQKYEKKLTSIPVEERDIIMLEMADEIEVKMDYFGNLPQNHPDRKALLSVAEIKQINIINKKLKKLKVVDYNSLGEWDSVWYKNYCSKNKSVTLPSNVSIIDLQEKLTSSPDGEIKSKHLGNNWEYSKLDGLWFARKINTEEWFLVSNCKSNNKIEVEYEKVVDPDVDKKSEFDTLMYQQLKNAGFDINQYIGIFNDEKK